MRRTLSLLHRPRRRLPSRVSRLVLLATLLATAACAHRKRGADDDGPMPLPEYVYVSVENHNWSDVIVSLVQADGLTSRIGTVAGSSNAVLRFPGRFIAASARLQLVARAVGGRATVRSEYFTVQPGQGVTWTLETSLQRSSLAVY